MTDGGILDGLDKATGGDGSGAKAKKGKKKTKPVVIVAGVGAAVLVYYLYSSTRRTPPRARPRPGPSTPRPESPTPTRPVCGHRPLDRRAVRQELAIARTALRAPLGAPQLVRRVDRPLPGRRPDLGQWRDLRPRARRELLRPFHPHSGRRGIAGDRGDHPEQPGRPAELSGRPVSIPPSPRPVSPAIRPPRTSRTTSTVSP